MKITFESKINTYIVYVMYAYGKMTLKGCGAGADSERDRRS